MTKAEEIADRIYEKLMQSRRQGDKNLWSGTPEQLRQILAEVKAEVEANRRRRINMIELKPNSAEWANEKIRQALVMLIEYGQTDGAHHKAWVIDQVVGILAGSEYDHIIAEACDGEDGPHTYSWDRGIPP